MNCQTHEDGDTISYTYDSTGRLATVVDSATGRTTTYTYDFADRTAKYTEIGTDYSHSVEYGYDETGKLISQTEIINGTTHSTAYTYDLDNRITAKTTDGITVEYTYDGLGRVTQQVTKNGDTTVKTETYTFNANSAQVATYRTQAGSYDVTYTYTYDDNGNILTVNDGTNTTSYVYDSQNQLLRENNPEWGFTKTWSYDEAGNILTNNRYDYTAGTLTTLEDTINYTYGDEDWGDLLTAYDGSTITYDGIGNPTSYRGRTLSWEHGRQLANMDSGTYTYDADGMRVGRTFGSYANYKYVYNGSQLVAMEYTSGSAVILLEFTYDAQGTPQTVSFNGTVYYYVTNLQGDVLRILDSEGTIIARYLYDAYGATAMASSNFLGQINPLRYRGYVYDQEYSTYYLQSRYYDPAVGRFINGDGLVTTGQGLTGGNMFAYCGNNPVNRADPTGHGWLDDLAEKVEEVAKKVWNVATDWAVVLAGAGASEIGGYALAGTLLQMAAVGETKFKASGDDYAAELIQSHSGFSNQIKEQYKQTNQYTGTGTYEFSVTDGDLGAALHWVEYSYCVLPGKPGKSEYLYVTVTDNFDFKWEDISYNNSYKSILLLLANNAAYIDAQLGGLQTVEIEIIVEIYP